MFSGQILNALFENDVGTVLTMVLQWLALRHLFSKLLSFNNCELSRVIPGQTELTQGKKTLKRVTDGQFANQSVKTYKN